MLGFLLVILCGYSLETARGLIRFGAYALWALMAPVLFFQFFELGVLAFAALVLAVIVAIAWTWKLSGIEVRDARRRLIIAGAAAGAGAPSSLQPP